LFYIYLLITSVKIFIPKIVVVFFIPIITINLITGLFQSLNILGSITEIHIQTIMINLLKLIVSILFLIIGFNFAKYKLTIKFIRFFLISNIIIIITSIVTKYFLNNDYFYYGGSRLKGLANDPNLYAIILMINIIIAINLRLSKKTMFFLITIFSIGVILTGSKTGLLLLLFYFLYILIINLKSILTHKNNIIKIFVLVILILSGMYYLSTQDIGVFSRINLINLNVLNFLFDGGSARTIAWSNALEILKISHIFGIGFSSYSLISNQINNSPTIAHNTYLQLIIEWGLISFSVFTLIFIYYVIRNIHKIKKRDIKINIEVIMIILISSLSISLNNFRLFWLFFGFIIYHSISKEVTYD
jgi:hypothetical protein